MNLIERAVAKQSTDSQPRQNDADMPPVPPLPQWSRELHECWKACREQLLRRVQAAGEVG